jgi:hypothetical protein
MIGKLLRLLFSLAAAFCVATVIAEAILVTYYVRAWELNREKLVQILAVARGVDLETVAEQAHADEAVSGEQPSYEQILEARALKARNIELREQSLRTGLQSFQAELRKMADEKNRLVQLREGFQGELAAMGKGAAAAGRDDVRRTLETIKPKQAKELIALMLERKEMDEVVVLMAGMPEAKRAKIVAEFKTPSEVEQLGEVLRRIRQGVPSSTMAESAQKQLESPKGPGS